MEKVTVFIKERWWLAPILAVMIILWLIPTWHGLPGDNYTGCEIEGVKCQNTQIKSVTKQSDNSMTIVVSAKITDASSQDLSIHLSHYNSGYTIGNTVFINYSESDHSMVLFIAQRSNLLLSLTIHALGSPGATAVIDTNTWDEIKR